MDEHCLEGVCSHREADLCSLFNVLLSGRIHFTSYALHKEQKLTSAPVWNDFIGQNIYYHVYAVDTYVIPLQYMKNIYAL